MKKALRDKWVTALRSGEYEQTLGQLKAGGGFCCLGVLCDIADPNGWCGELHYSQFGVPDSEFRKAVGLPDELVNSLWRLNDNERKPFSDIADWIEQNVPVE